MSFSKEEKIFMEIIKSNLASFNANKRKGKLTVDYVVDGGNRAEIRKDGELLLNVTIDQAWAAVAAIIRYKEV